MIPAKQDRPEPILQVRNLKTYFASDRGIFKKGKVSPVRAVDDLSFDIYEGETLGLVGESGCGKSTLARTILRLAPATDGQVYFRGREILDLKDSAFHPLKRDLQIIFQDPYSSLNPRMRVQDIIYEGWRAHKNALPRDQWRGRVIELMDLVGLSEEHLDRYPHQMSGGQQQRIGIARALALEPKIIFADEPVSALDVSIQAQIINLLEDIQEATGVSLVFIAHDLSVVRHIANRIAVMYLGKIVEFGDAEQIYETPTHPYTQALLSSVLELRPWEGSRERLLLPGDPPSPTRIPSGCRFRTRCWKAVDLCAAEEPTLEPRVNRRLCACHFAELPSATSKRKLGAS